MRYQHLVLAVLIPGGTAMTAISDEGMWLLNDPPRELLKEKYGFDLTDAWLDNAPCGPRSGSTAAAPAASSRRTGCSSPTTTSAPTPCRSSASQGHGPATRRLLRPTRDEELKCPDLELNVLQEIVDVTDGGERGGQAGDDAGRGVRGAAGGDGDDREGVARQDRPALRRGHALPRRAVPPLPLQEVHRRAARLRPGAGHRRLRRRRGQLRVPALSTSTSAFFRAYENGKPAKTPHFFKWSETGPKENDLVFVTGHPGTTNRLETLAQAQAPPRRDACRTRSTALRTLEAALTQYGEQRPEKRRAGRERPAPRRQRPQGLQRATTRGCSTRRSWSRRQDRSGRCRRMPARTPDVASPVATDDPGRGDRRRSKASSPAFEKPYSLLEIGHAFQSPLFTHRPALRPHGRGAAQEVRRSAARVSRLQPRIAQVRACSSRADLSGPGARAS